MLFHATVTVMLKGALLDTAGRALLEALRGMGRDEVKDLRMGKSLQLTFEAPDRDEAQKALNFYCKELLVNPIIEEAEYRLEEANR